MYSIQPIDENQEKQPEDASYQQDLQQQMTLNQRCQREEIYEKDIEKIKDRDKIPTDEVVKLIECLTLVIEDCRSDNLLGVEDKQEIEEKPYGAIVFEENNRDIGPDVVHEDREAHQYQYGQEVIRTDEHQTRGYSSNSYRRRKEIYASEQAARTRNNLNNFCLCIQRWMCKASNGTIIRGNIPPFTPTGDFNDAPYPILLLNKNPWWPTSTMYSDFVHSSPEIYFRYPPLIMGSWFSHNEACHYFHNLINKDIVFREERQNQHRMLEQLQQENEQTKLNKSDHRARTKLSRIIHNTKFTTELKEGQVAWDITEDTMILNEYEKIRERNKTKKFDENPTAWQRLVQRSVQLLSDMKEGRIDLHSDILEGKIGNELKTEEEISKLNELDNPNNKRWTIRQSRRCHDLAINDYEPYHVKYKVIGRLLDLCTEVNNINHSVLLDPVVQCLCSNYYLNAYEMIDLRQPIVNPKQWFFIHQCPQFIRLHSYQRQDEISDSLCDLMLEYSNKIFEQHLPILIEGESIAVQANRTGKIIKNDQGAKLQAIGWHIALLNHVALTPTTKIHFITGL
ncbi:unnamed protein product [Rotaria sp. Silwood1]|nr:unnamed protein product [Rotaria sp. Silwood1]